MRIVLVFAALALAAAVIVPRYVSQHGEAIAPTVLAAHPQAPVQTAGSDSHSVVISPNRNGHFEVEGHIDGRRMDFMVDTCASLVALTARDAAMLGIHPAERDYVATVKTANGVVHAAPARHGRDQRSFGAQCHRDGHAGGCAERQSLGPVFSVAAAPFRVFGRQAGFGAVASVIPGPCRFRSAIDATILDPIRLS
jgi:aspartyl protease family protein